MTSGIEDRDAVDELSSLSLEDHFTPTQPGSLRLPFPPSIRPLPDDHTSTQPSRLRLPSPPPTKRIKNDYPAEYSDSDSISSISSTPPSPDLTPAPSQTSPETLSPSEQALLLTRIQSGLSYTRIQHSLNLPITQTTRFSLSPLSPSHLPALRLLRKHATRISSSPTHEVYELGIPRPDWVQEGAIAGVHDAQWWMGKSRAEIKAGPWADEGDVKVAESRIRGAETRRRKRRGGKVEKEREWKLREGVRLAEMERGSEGESSDEGGDEKMDGVVEEEVGEDEENEEDVQEDEQEKVEVEEQEEVEEQQEDEENNGDAMEGVEYGNSEPPAPSSRKLRSQGSPDPTTGSGPEYTPSSMTLRSQTGTKSSPSSKKSKSQVGSQPSPSPMKLRSQGSAEPSTDSEPPTGPKPSTRSRRLKSQVDSESSPSSKKLKSQDGSEPSKTSSRKLRSQGGSDSRPSTPSSRKLKSQGGSSSSPLTMRLRSQGGVDSLSSSRVLRSRKM